MRPGPGPMEMEEMDTIIEVPTPDCPTGRRHEDARQDASGRIR